MRFSRRTEQNREQNALSAKLLEAERRGLALVDLTESNPTRVGLGDPQLHELCADPRGGIYSPTACGMLEARRAVSGYYRARGVIVEPHNIVLSASTSESYSWLFKLLCDPGDIVLVPAPAYPLLPFLAEFSDVRLVSYPLVRDDRWRIDFGELERTLDREPRARAIIVVHPGNPSGAFTHKDEALGLSAIARARDLALVVDEVFADYAHAPLADDRLPTFAATEGAPTFVLSGLSKVALAPHLKLGWLVLAGANMDEARARLELLADSFLSVATPVQVALPAILERSVALQTEVRARLAENLAALDAAIATIGGACPVRRLPVEGGWYVLIEVPRTRTDDEWVARTIDEAFAVVHPGYFFDIREAGTLVVSLLGERSQFALAITRAVRLWALG
ncbi:MAG: pyridoxal phosphate-dependent aminotransferase [Myxococcales bacterium]|nr:pyridoxal phosphate-dependent aminotransferase [Myxococcales bacterium]